MSTQVPLEDEMVFLRLLVDLATRGAFQARILMFVNGATIVGTLVSTTDWMDMFSDMVHARFPVMTTEVPEALTSAMKRMNETMIDAQTPATEASHAFVHLCDVLVDGRSVAMLRLRLSQVDGWGFVGEFSRYVGQVARWTD